jgi:hypothetical protein
LRSIPKRRASSLIGTPRTKCSRRNSAHRSTSSTPHPPVSIDQRSSQAHQPPGHLHPHPHKGCVFNRQRGVSFPPAPTAPARERSSSGPGTRRSACHGRGVTSSRCGSSRSSPNVTDLSGYPRHSFGAGGCGRALPEDAPEAGHRLAVRHVLWTTLGFEGVPKARPNPVHRPTTRSMGCEPRLFGPGIGAVVGQCWACPRDRRSDVSGSHASRGPLPRDAAHARAVTLSGPLRMPSALRLPRGFTSFKSQATPRMPGSGPLAC